MTLVASFVNASQRPQLALVSLITHVAGAGVLSPFCSQVLGVEGWTMLSPKATHTSGVSVPALPFPPGVTGDIVRAVVQPFGHMGSS